MTSYEELKTELQEIAKLLGNYPESLQKQVFDLLMDRYLGKSGDGDRPSNERKQKHSGSRKSKTKKTPARKESFKIVKDLNLRGNKETPSFRTFVDQKKPRSNLQFNTVSIYYLKQMLQLEKVTPDHVYTCYREVTRRPSGKFQQSFWDTSRRYGYIDTSKMNDLGITLLGTNFVEHDLPASKSKEKEAE